MPEDIMFQIGLGEEGFTGQLIQAEQSSAAILERIAKQFEALKARIEKAGEGEGLRHLFDGLKASAQDINDKLRETRVLLDNAKSNAAGRSVFEIDTTTARDQIKTLASSVRNLKKDIEQPSKSSIVLFGPNGQPLPLSSAGGGSAPRASTSSAVAGSSAASRARAAALTSANSAFDGFNQRQDTFNQVFQRSAGILRNVSTVLSTIGVGGGIFGLIYGFKSLVADGIEFNSQLQQAGVSIGAIVAATAQKIELDGQQVTGLAAVEAVQGDVATVLSKLKADALITNGTFQDLLTIFTSISPVVLRLGGSLGDAERLTRATAVAASALGIGFDQAALGVVELLNNTARVTNPLIQRLPGQGLEQLKEQLKDGSTRTQVLLNTLNKLAPAGDLIQHTFAGALATIKDYVQQLSGQTLSPITDRLTSGLNSAVKGLAKQTETGVVFAPGVEDRIERIRTLIDDLSIKATEELKTLFNVGTGDSFLTTLEVALPRLEDDLFAVINALKSVGGFLEDHGRSVLSLIEIYAGFRIATGVYFSLAGSIKNVIGAFGSFSSTLTGVVSKLTQAAEATVATEGEFIAANAAAATFSTTLGTLGTVGLLGALLAGVVAVGTQIYEDHKAAQEFQAGLEGLNSLQFDGLIAHLGDVARKVKEATSGIFEDYTHDSEATIEDAAKTGAKSAIEARRVATIAAEQAGLSSVDLNSAKGIGAATQALRKKKILADNETDITAEQKAKETELYERASEAIKKYMDVLTRVKQIRDNISPRKAELEHDISLPVAEGDPNAGGTRKIDTAALDALNPLLDSLGLARAYSDVSQLRAKITPSKYVPPKEKGIDKAQDAQRSKTVELIKESGTEQLSLLDKNAASQNEALQARLAQRLLDARQEAEAELNVARDLSLSKVDILQQETERLFKVFGEQPGVSAILKNSFGLTDFNSLIDQKPGDIAENAYKFQTKNAKAPTKAAAQTNTEGLAAAKSLQEVYQKYSLAREALSKQELKTVKDIADAERESGIVISRINEELADRAAKTALEVEQQRNVSSALDDRLEREKRITAEITAQRLADISKKTSSQLSALATNPKLTQSDALSAQLAVLEQAAAESATAVQQSRLESISREAQIRDEVLNQARTQLTIDEAGLNTLRSRLGPDNVLVAQLDNKLIKEKEILAIREEQNQLILANKLDSEGDDVGAEAARQKASILASAAQALDDSTKNFYTIIGDGLQQLGSSLNVISTRLGGITSAVGKFVSAAGSIQKLGGLSGLGNVFSTASSNAGGGFAGGLSGALAVAGPIGSAVGALAGVFKSVIDLLNSGFKEVLDASVRKVNAATATALNALNSGQQGVGTTIGNLQNIDDNVASYFPKPVQGGGFLDVLISPIYALLKTVAAYQSNAERDKAITDAKIQLQQQIDQLKQQAANTVYKLENETLPELSVTSAMRQYEDKIIAIQKELKDLADTPGVSNEDLSRLFDYRTADLFNDAIKNINTEKQNYLNYLQQEQDLTLQLSQLENQHAQSQLDYENQRAALLGETVRQLTKQQQLNKLDTDHNLSEQAYNAQKAQLEEKLTLAADEVAIYTQEFGIIKDTKQYQLDINRQIIEEQQAGLDALLTYYTQLQGIANGTVAAFLKITPTNVSATTGAGGTLSGTVDPTLTTPAGGGGDTIINFNGDFSVGQGQSVAEFKNAVKSVMKETNFNVKRRGLSTL